MQFIPRVSVVEAAEPSQTVMRAEPGPLDAGAAAGVLLARAGNALARRMRAALKPHKLSVAQYQLLAGLASMSDEPPAGRSQARLAAAGLIRK